MNKTGDGQSAKLGDAPSLTPEAMMELLGEHDKLEFGQDWVGTMRTVSADAVYEMYPQGLRIAGAAAVEAFYRRTIPAMQDLLHMVDAAPRTLSFGEGTLVVERQATLHTSEEPVLTRWITVFELDGDLIRAERTYLDAAFARVFEERFPDLTDIPGVANT
jgi:hypothetical protein